MNIFLRLLLKNDDSVVKTTKKKDPFRLYIHAKLNQIPVHLMKEMTAGRRSSLIKYRTDHRVFGRLQVSGAFALCYRANASILAL